MKTSSNPSTNLRPDLLHPLNTLVTTAAESLQAFTIAIYLKSSGDRLFRLISHRTLSQHFVTDAPLLLERSRIVALFRKGSISHETHAAVAPLVQEIYSRSEPVQAMLVAPVSDKALLIVDTVEPPAFQPSQIKFVQGLARTVEGILGLANASDGMESAISEFSTVAELLNGYRLAQNISDTFFDDMVSSLVSKGRFDGALIATVSTSSMSCRIRSVSGFSKSLNRGRVIKLRPGWAKWSIEQLQSVIMGSPRSGEAFVPVFHSGEALGFPVKSAVIVPWTKEQGIDGFLLLASRKEDPTLESDRKIWEFLGAVLGIVRRNIVNEKLLKAVRLYDGESGLMNESFFRAQTGIKFMQAITNRLPCSLILVAIENIDKIYLEHDISRIKKFLTIFTERLLNLDKRGAIVGKFRTGGFGVFLENFPVEEATSTVRRVMGLFSIDVTNVDGAEIRHSVKVGWCHYPTECSSFEDFWRQALLRLTKAKSATGGSSGWSNF
ncbi:MAG: GGDEF domain-containing protein [Desulfomonilaceae bacterium]